jgi:hypothetical protein
LSPGDLLRIGKKRDVEGEIHLIGALKNHRSPAVPVSSLEKISSSFSDTVGHLPRPQRCWVPDRADLHLMRGEVELRWADLRPGGQRRQELEAGSDGSEGNRSILARREHISRRAGHGVGLHMLRISSSMFMELKSLSTPSSSPSWQPSSLTTQINAKTIISRVKYARLPRARQSGEKRDYVGKGVPTPPPPLFLDMIVRAAGGRCSVIGTLFSSVGGVPAPIGESLTHSTGGRVYTMHCRKRTRERMSC